MSDTHTFRHISTGNTITVTGVTHLQIIARLCSERRRQLDEDLRAGGQMVNTIRAEISETGSWLHVESGRKYAIKMRACTMASGGHREEHADPLPHFARGRSALRGWV